MALGCGFVLRGFEVSGRFYAIRVLVLPGLCCVSSSVLTSSVLHGMWRYVVCVTWVQGLRWVLHCMRSGVTWAMLRGLKNSGGFCIAWVLVLRGLCYEGSRVLVSTVLHGLWCYVVYVANIRGFRC